MQDPFDPFGPGSTGDPMNDVLSLQTFGVHCGGQGGPDTTSCWTHACASLAGTNGCTTNGCPCSETGGGVQDGG